MIPWHLVWLTDINPHRFMDASPDVKQQMNIGPVEGVARNGWFSGYIVKIIVLYNYRKVPW